MKIVKANIIEFFTFIWFWVVLSSTPLIFVMLLWMFTFGGFAFIPAVQSFWFMIAEGAAILGSGIMSFLVVTSPDEKNYVTYTTE